MSNNPVVVVRTVKKLPSCFWFVTDGGTKSFQAQIIDESFLQRLLECRSGGGSSPTTIAIKWATNESKGRILITSIVSFMDDNTDDTDTDNNNIRGSTTSTRSSRRRLGVAAAATNAIAATTGIATANTNKNTIAGDIAGTK